MSMYQRAAQFAPFAALTGHDQAIQETVKKNVESYKTLPFDKLKINLAQDKLIME